MPVPASSLYAAEEVIDPQTETTRFQGQNYSLTTGRVLLHALGPGGQPLCGQAQDLTPTARPWRASYLPHAPRCPACATATGQDTQPPASGSELPATLPAADVDIRTAHHDDSGEQAAAAALRAVLSQHDLRRWMLTDLITIDTRMRGGLSHPLTISPQLILRRPASALTTFLHEQLHWLSGPATDRAAAEASTRWPDPPPTPAGGTDAESTWLHMSTCALEYQSLAILLGPAAAAAELTQHTSYSWIYSQILADPRWFTSYLNRHGLHIPDEPPLPRRHIATLDPHGNPLQLLPT